MSIKYYLAHIDERHGEFEPTISYLFCTKLDPSVVADIQVKQWYNMEPDEDPDREGVYWNDCMTYSCGGYSEIKKETYEDIKNKLPELHNADNDKYIFVFGEDKND
jgi:hypothetical protein